MGEEGGLTWENECGEGERDWERERQGKVTNWSGEWLREWSRDIKDQSTRTR